MQTEHIGTFLLSAKTIIVKTEHRPVLLAPLTNGSFTHLSLTTFEIQPSIFTMV